MGEGSPFAVFSLSFEMVFMNKLTCSRHDIAEKLLNWR
jgi:hypothetical protein